MSRAHSRFRAALMSRRTRLWTFFAFLTLTALFGGGSRDEIQSLLLLRPLAVIACGAAVLFVSPADLRAVRVPLILLLGFMLLHLIQLAPLPPALWQSLPQRGLVAEIDRAIGLGQIWRPLTLSPAKTLNSLFALFIPLAALLLFAALDPRDRSRTFVWLAGFALASAILGILQLLGGAESPFYLYRITNESYPVGLFANRNHQSFVLAGAVFVLFWMASDPARWPLPARAILLLSGILVLFMVALIFVTGSRAGLLLTFLSAVAGLALLLRSPLAAREIAIGPARRVRARWLVGLFAVVLAGLGVAVVALSRDVAFGRLMAEDGVQGMRVSLLPVLGEMVRDFVLVGAGMGSFEFVYKLYEPFDLLGPRYLNEAHNDWAQVVIEGGAPAIALVLSLLVWLAAQTRRLFQGRVGGRTVALPAFWILLLLGIASIFDYPLHVPVLAAVFALMTGIVSVAANDERARSAQIGTG